MSVAISAQMLCSVLLFLQLFVKRFMSYLFCLCLLRGGDIPLDLSMNRMFCTSLAPLDCRRAPVLFMLFVFICCLVSLRIVFPIFSVSMDCPFLIAPSAFSKVYLIKYMHISQKIYIKMQYN